MCPSPPSPPLPPADEISTQWTDEEVCTILEKIKHGSRLPGNVIPDVNPCQHKPSDLPADIWYFISSGMKMEAAIGIWKAKGEACKVYTGSAITGWRTTYEFYEDQASYGHKTDWVMQEYKITKGVHESSISKDSSSLCRVFRSNVQSSNNEMQQNLASSHVAGIDEIYSILSDMLGENSSSGQNSTSRSNVSSRDKESETVTVAVEQGPLNIPIENLPLSDDDYIELLDLDNPASSSSSENSSCLSRTSDEYFDSLALHELEAEGKTNEQRTKANCKFSILASGRPNEVVISPATAGSLVSGNLNKSPAEALKTDCSPPGLATEQTPHDKMVVKPGISGKKADNNIGGPSSKSHTLDASSKGDKGVRGKEKEAVTGKKTKLKKNYFCFIPF